MRKKIDKTGYDEALEILRCLKKDYPTLTLGQHLSTALADYGDIWGMTDKELAFALEKYETELEYNQGVEDKDLDKIIEEGKNLDTLFKSEEEDDLFD